MISTKVMITENAEKQLSQVPHYIRDKLYQWVERVEVFGIQEFRKIKGFHDEPLQGMRLGQRSIRLNNSYRAIYIQKTPGDCILIRIIEVTKHEY